MRQKSLKLEWRMCGAHWDVLALIIIMKAQLRIAKEMQ